jgi:6-phosphogluconate dehydrogenase
MNNKKEIGIIGLGKMGFRIAENLLEKGFEVVAYDINKEFLQKIVEKGAARVYSIKEIKERLIAPRVILLSIPSGEITGKVIKELESHLTSGDTIIDSGNSFYKDSQQRAVRLKKTGIDFIDLGISGGISGARHGACLMIGGEKDVFEKVEHVFKALSKDGSYKYLGKNGAGHLVKGYHNLVEYGYMEALAEGIFTLKSISKQQGMDIVLKDVCEIWNKGSLVESRLVGKAQTAFENNSGLQGISGSVYGQTHKEMEELIKIARDLKVDVPSCEAAVNVRKNSQTSPNYIGKILNAIRNVFGGHEEWKK